MAASVATTTGQEKPATAPHIGRLETLEYWLDRGFRLPGTEFRFGLDGVIGLVPGVGDTATAILSGYFMLEAWRIGGRRRTLAKMAGNVGVDWLLGAIPLVGDIFDFANKANTKNLRLLRAEHEHLAGAARVEPRRSA